MARTLEHQRARRQRAQIQGVMWGSRASKMRDAGRCDVIASFAVGKKCTRSVAVQGKCVRPKVAMSRVFDSKSSLPLNGVPVQNSSSITIELHSVAILVPTIMPSALELTVLTILWPHFRIQDGASLVSAKVLDALATLWPRGVAGQRHVQTMQRPREHQ